MRGWQQAEDARIEADRAEEIARDDVDIAGDAGRFRRTLDGTPCDDVLDVYHFRCLLSVPAVRPSIERRASPARGTSLSRRREARPSRPPKPIHLRRASFVLSRFADHE